MRTRARAVCSLLVTLALFSCGDDAPSGGGGGAGGGDAAIDGSTVVQDAGERDSGGDPAADASTDAGDASQPACDEYEVTLTSPLEVMLLIDGSASMGEPLGNTSTTHWEALREAMFGNADGVITRIAQTAPVGLAIYGATPMCPFPLEVQRPKLDNGAALAAAFPELPPGEELAPAAPAIDAVVEQLALESGQFTTITLITSSAPTTCEAESELAWEATVQAAQNANRARHQLNVIGLGDVPREELERVAAVGSDFLPAEGEVPTVQVPTDVPGLRFALAQNVDIVSCALDLDVAVAPDRACEGTVTINGSIVPCNAGWRVTRPTRLELLGETCTRFGANAEITATFPCSALEHPPGTCATHDDCGPKHAACFRGKCVGCVVDGDCALGETCSAQECVR